VFAATTVMFAAAMVFAAMAFVTTAMTAAVASAFLCPGGAAGECQRRRGQGCINEAGKSMQIHGFLLSKKMGLRNDPLWVF
jgi:hypothetical protein